MSILIMHIRKVTILHLLIFIILFSPIAVIAQTGHTEIRVGEISGLDSENNALANKPIYFNMEWINDHQMPIVGFSHGFRIWTTNNGYTSNFTPATGDTIPGVRDYFDDFIIHPFNSDGLLEDTMTFGGFDTLNIGFPPSTTVPFFRLETTPTAIGDTICFDSITFFPHAYWQWISSDGVYHQPEWNGPYCYYIDANCGDANGNGDINIMDIVYLIAYLYQDGNPSLLHNCVGDVNGDNTINIMDLIYLINFLYKGAQPPIENCCQPIW